MAKNQELAKLFEEIGKALEFKGENQFKIIAYYKVARVLRDLPQDIEQIWKAGKLREIPGIGEGIAKKIDEYLKTGRMSKYEEVMKDIPKELLELMDVQSLGPRTLKLAYERLGVKTKEDLLRVIENGSLEKLPGMGKKKVENIKKGLEIWKGQEERISIGIALPLVERIVNYLKGEYPDVQISPAGSLRRMKETVGDIDILVGKDNGKEIIETFTKFEEVERILAKGDTKGSIIVKSGEQVDLRVVPIQSYGAALQYFTGSKAHNIKLRTIAKGENLKVSEYGVFRGDKFIAGRTEEEVYAVFGLPWIPPELREDRGEIELAMKGQLPKIVEYNEIKGDMHVHSNYSDGADTIEKIAKYAKELGYEYIVIADHSKSAKYAHGMDEERVKKQWEEIDRVAKQVGIKIFKGIEVEIDREGNLDFSQEFLAKFDVVIAAFHRAVKQDLTPIFIKVCHNPHVDIIAHPTGRLISQRAGYTVDIDRVIEEASKTNTALEINAYYDRLDLSDINAKKAKDKGVKISIGSDAHNVGMLNYLRFGIGNARRAWLEKDDILNTLSAKELENWLKTHKAHIS